MATNRIATTVFYLGTLFSLSLPAGAAERVIEKSVSVDADAVFTLNSFRDTVHIRTADVDTITVTATISHDDEDALDRVNVDLSGSARNVRVRVERVSTPSGWNWDFRDQDDRGPYYPEVELDIVLPQTLDLRLNSHRSRLDIAAPSGNVRIEDHRGQGSITGLRSDVRLNSHRSELDLEISELHDLDIKDHRGDIRIDILSSEDDFEIDGKAHRGDFRFRGRDIETEQDGRHGIRVNHRSGKGSKLILLDSHRGDIRINFKD